MEIGRRITNRIIREGHGLGKQATIKLYGGFCIIIGEDYTEINRNKEDITVIFPHKAVCGGGNYSDIFYILDYLSLMCTRELYLDLIDDKQFATDVFSDTFDFLKPICDRVFVPGSEDKYNIRGKTLRDIIEETYRLGFIDKSFDDVALEAVEAGVVYQTSCRPGNFGICVPTVYATDTHCVVLVEDGSYFGMKMDSTGMLGDNTDQINRLLSILQVYSEGIPQRLSDHGALWVLLPDTDNEEGIVLIPSCSGRSFEERSLDAQHTVIFGTYDIIGDERLAKRDKTERRKELRAELDKRPCLLSVHNTHITLFAGTTNVTFWRRGEFTIKQEFVHEKKVSYELVLQDYCSMYSRLSTGGVNDKPFLAFLDNIRCDIENGLGVMCKEESVYMSRIKGGLLLGNLNEPRKTTTYLKGSAYDLLSSIQEFYTDISDKNS